MVALCGLGVGTCLVAGHLVDSMFASNMLHPRFGTWAAYSCVAGHSTSWCRDVSSMLCIACCLQGVQLFAGCKQSTVLDVFKHWCCVILVV